MADQITIAQQLLCRVAGSLSDADVAAWAGGLLKELENEGPSFGTDLESLSDVLKRCSFAGEERFALSADDLRRLLLRLSSLQGPLPPFPDRGRFLACRRFGKFFPAGSGFVSSCQRCGTQVVVPRSGVPRLRECDGALLCWKCAQTFPGRVVDIGPR